MFIIERWYDYGIKFKLESVRVNLKPNQMKS